ncbi:hypothetical protein B0H16DRAFT_1770984 [Mycena metata]|uniref:DUF6697 domain-containing protein n=1 Tax=Mycena metata TaxID=1033252 RepID=A0AAD7NQR2_9AGAR|nr:hypothetical protein B0H16DRAFT_1770984 [Mycena metata]
MSNPPGILLTSDLTPEVVEFWGFKYKEAKQELETLKRSGAYDNVPTYGELKRHNELLQTEAITNTKRLEAKEKFIQEIVASNRNEYRATQQRLDACNAEKRDLLLQIGRLNTERVSLHHQIQVCYSQAASLAAEADRQRMAAVAELFNPGNSFLDESFTPTSFMFSSLQQLIASLPRDTSNDWQLYFMPRPPNSIPLRVQEVGKPGYWFYPFNLSPMDAPFELVVEIECNKWLYFGRYTSCTLPSYEMRLSEWMALDEQTKLIFCSRVASQNSKLPIQPGSYTTPIDIRQRYESGQWNVPCYSLQCVGYDMELYEALQSTALRCERDVSTISRSQSLGKRRRTETPSICGLGEDQPTKSKTARIEGTAVGDLDKGE